MSDLIQLIMLLGVSDGIVGEVQESDAVVNADDCGNDGELTDEYVSEMNKLISEQKNDESLKLCWAQAKEKKGNFIVSRGVLYHQDKVEGLPVSQLCVPKGRRPVSYTHLTLPTKRIV